MLLPGPADLSVPASSSPPAGRIKGQTPFFIADILIALS